MKKEMKSKKNLFDNIIGYEDIKKSLETIIDVLNNEEKYKKLGCTIPHGLLLYGPPGTGKTSFAKGILDSSINRKTYIIKKTKSNGSFIDYMSEIFNKAINNQPAIILLDDLDKFSESDNDGFQEEYITVQSLIDDVKDKDVFVIATVNAIHCLPKSLRRSGRFDIQIKIDNPKEIDAFNIFKYYLKKKKIDKDVDYKKISCILTDSSCAELEKVCNQAGIYAGYKNKNKIGMNELLRAALELKYESNIENNNENDNYSINTAYHEAGHALVAELLEPNSISFITIANKEVSDIKGITIYRENDNYYRDITFLQNRIKSLLAGKASIEIVFNKCSIDTSSDIKRAHGIAKELVDDFCMIDFNSLIDAFSELTAEKVKETKATNTMKLLNEYYSEVKVLLAINRKLLDKLANELNNRKILFQDEIREIIWGNSNGSKNN